MLPSLPSKVLGGSVAPDDATKRTPKTANAAMTASPAGQYRRPRPRRTFLDLLILSRSPCKGPEHDPGPVPHPQRVVDPPAPPRPRAWAMRGVVLPGFSGDKPKLGVTRPRECRGGPRSRSLSLQAAHLEHDQDPPP